jgi:hypothetical protein
VVVQPCAARTGRGLGRHEPGGQAVAAPICTRHLGDLGARVIKVENRDGGGFARDYDHVVRGMAAHFVWAMVKNPSGDRCLSLQFAAPFS